MTELLTATATPDKEDGADEFYDEQSLKLESTDSIGPFGGSWEARTSSADLAPAEAEKDLGQVAIEAGLRFAKANLVQSPGLRPMTSDTEKHDIAS